MLDAVTGFNQVAKTPRANRVLSVLTRAEQFLPVCLTFGPANGPEDFAYVMDRMYAPGLHRRIRVMTEWLAYVDDHTIRRPHGRAYTDEEVASQVRTAVTECAGPKGYQDVAEALEAAGRLRNVQGLMVS